MNHKIIEKPLLKTIGLKIRVKPYDKNIPQLWDKFMSRNGEIKNNIDAKIAVGICCYQPDKNAKEFDYIAGVLVTDESFIPDGMVYYEIPANRYAVFTHKGPLDSLGQTFGNIFKKWLPENNLKLAPADEIEWYDERFKFGEPDSEMDILVAVK